jgi:hypothetical protein
MTETFSISIDEWLGPAGGSAVEQATNAEISIRVGGIFATQVEDFVSKTVRSNIRVSAEPIAKWLLANWWRLKCETEPIVNEKTHSWAMSHSLAAIGEGYIWPDLVFRGSDGSQISLECKRHLSADDDKLSPVRFLNSFRASISVDDFESSARSFAEAVMARLAGVGIRHSELHELWSDLSAEWANSKYASHRRLEALLGLEPDQNDVLIASAMKWGKQFGPNALDEIAAESNSKEITAILKEARALAKDTKTFADIHDVGRLVATAGSDSLSGTPWQEAQALAYLVRDKWGFGDQPISDEALAERLSLNVSKLRETHSNAPLSFGVRGTRNGKLGLLLNRTHDEGRRFDTARLLGDYLGFDHDEKILPATNAMTRRQKFQRAFAAEFLCPSRMIQSQYSNLDQRTVAKAVDEISTDYIVSEQVVLHHMENRNVLAQEFPDNPLLWA